MTRASDCVAYLADQIIPSNFEHRYQEKLALEMVNATFLADHLFVCLFGDPGGFCLLTLLSFVIESCGDGIKTYWICRMILRHQCSAHSHQQAHLLLTHFSPCKVECTGVVQ